jgi:hypothetical protein
VESPGAAPEGVTRWAGGYPRFGGWARSAQDEHAGVVGVGLRLPRYEHAGVVGIGLRLLRQVAADSAVRRPAGAGNAGRHQHHERERDGHADEQSHGYEYAVEEMDVASRRSLQAAVQVTVRLRPVRQSGRDSLEPPPWD